MSTDRAILNAWARFKDVQARLGERRSGIYTLKLIRRGLRLARYLARKAEFSYDG